MLYDVFISHASEDKETLVRPLADALRVSNIAVWFDEFELKVGVSLRRSIDLGLSKSRFGIVVLSKAFFGKRWPQWELDGLVQRQMSSSNPVLLPIWLDVTYEDVLVFSPSLVDKYALNAQLGLDRLVAELLRVIKPQGSSIVVARDRLIELGYDPPVVTDDWWHHAIEYCGSNDQEGTFQDAMGWGRWGFPLPPRGDTAKEKGERIAWAALQLNWQEYAEHKRISQITHPDEVHDFIEHMPGLATACFKFPHFLATYAPQLTIPGFGGRFEEVFDDWLHHSRAVLQEKRIKGARDGAGLTIDGQVPTCDEPIALHDKAFGNYEPAHIACFYVQGDLMGPPVKVYDTIDYVLWLLSHASNWMPVTVREYLIDGLKEWAVWPWSRFQNDSEFTGNKSTGKLQDTILRIRSHETLNLSRTVRQDLDSRIEYSIRTLCLPETVSELGERFLSMGFIESWFKRHRGRKKRA